MKATVVDQIPLGLQHFNQRVLVEGTSVWPYRLYPIDLVPPFAHQQKYHAHSSQKP